MAVKFDHRKVPAVKCLGGCGVYTEEPTGYCEVCEPEVDSTKYDTGEQ